MEFVRTKTLSIAVEATGPENGWPVMLLHGFPYDAHSYDQVAALLVAQGARVIVPYLRGFGATKFLSADTMRSGQQAAVAMDAAELIETLGLKHPILSGFDWGGRSAHIIAALWPSTIGGLVSTGGYSIQDIAHRNEPDHPLAESRDWYQYYFHGERGAAGLTKYRRELAAQLWAEWAPGRPLEGFDLTAPSFDNPDFVDIVIHSYRHRFGLVAGDPAYDAVEAQLAQLPTIDVPTIMLDLTEDPILPPLPLASHREYFTNLVDYRLVAAGHDVPRHKPAAVADAILALHERFGTLHSA